MAETSTFRGALEFLNRLGVFDVVLPFLLVFTITFAILEKTKVFGTDKIGDHQESKKNLNAMTAFVVAFFVIASSRLVEIITQVSAQMVVLLMGSVLFLLLVGSFMKESHDGVALEGPVQAVFVGIMGVGLLGIFLNALKTPSGKTWLETLLGWLTIFWNGSATNSRDAISSVILLVLIVGVMFYITKDNKSSESKSGSSSGGGSH